jgi:hypothetical protein
MFVVIGALLLAGSLAFGYVLWIRPQESRLDLHTKAVMVLVLLTLAGAFWGALPWWLDKDDTFSWDLPPLASRMLGAAAVAFVPAGVFALARPTPDRLRLQLVMLVTYLAPRVLAIAALHLDYFDFGRPIVWAFFLLSGGMSLAALYFLQVRPEMSLPDSASPATQPPYLRAWLGAVAAVMLAWGLALFVTDDGGAKDVWVWPGDALASRLIGVMLLTIAATAVYALVRPATTSMALGVIGTYGIAGAVANVWQGFLDKPVKEGYVVVLGAIGVISLVLLAMQVMFSQKQAVGR